MDTHPNTSGPTLSHDQFGRQIEYLRISVTDRCNFRCLYCMPPEGLPWIARDELLTDDEIVTLVAQLAPMGLRRLRITGGEPTLRPQLAELISRLRAISAIDDIALSTNGVHLTALAVPLRDAGLDRVNISADSLRPNRIAAIARRNITFSPVDAALSAERCGITPIKLNVVLMRGVNDDEIEDFARLTLDHPWYVRFIELMPVGDMQAHAFANVVPSATVLERISALGALTRDDGPLRGNGPAVYYRLPNAAGSIGVITPMTHTYCGSCNRVRVTADGRLRTCLFGDHEVALRPALRAGLNIVPLYRQALAEKPREHDLLHMQVGGLRALSETGG